MAELIHWDDNNGQGPLRRLTGSRREPYPTQPMGRNGTLAQIVSLGRLYSIRNIMVPGIAAADALDINDAFGTVMAIPVPKAGAIVKATFHDLDNEGLGKILWMLDTDPTTNAPASDAAWTLIDNLSHTFVDVLTFSTFRTGSAGQFSASTDVPCWYAAPAGFLYCQFQTLGADNIAAGVNPRLSLLIERYDLDTGV